MADVLVRYFASAKAASGVAEEHVEAVDLSGVLSQVATRYGDKMTAILAACSLLLDGVHVSDPATTLPGVCSLDVLPPFAGG